MAGYREVAPGTELTEREQQMLSDHDAGMSAQDLAEKHGYSNPNAAGNVVRRALTKAGRESEIGGGQRRAAQASTPRPRRNVEDSVVDPIQQMRDARERAMAQLDDFRTELEEMEREQDATQDDVLDAERNRLQEVIDRATQALGEFEEWDEERQTKFFETHHTAAVSRYDGNHEHLENAIAKAEKAVAAADQFLEMFQDEDEDEETPSES